ncbi:MAG: hypothetical protein QOI46_6412, partial [Alphaproteobacteria bacterium]|nr:hypothetical protein [Alphaproteobacteria bacterium]
MTPSSQSNRPIVATTKDRPLRPPCGRRDLRHVLSIVALAFMMLAVGAPPAAADDRAMCFTGTFSGSVKDDNVAACTR